jgi:hypothetical protein
MGWRVSRILIGHFLFREADNISWSQRNLRWAAEHGDG